MDLTGRGALVTGGSGDLGTAICRALAAAGADVAVGYVGNTERAAETCRIAEALGRRAVAIQLDQAEPAAVDPAVDAAAAKLGRLDVLVNNAAWNIAIPFPQLDQVTTEVWDRIFATNVRGPFQLARAAAVHMRRQGAGRIVNIGSIAAFRTAASSIPYAASKAALVHLNRCLAAALAPEITVNCISPGLIEGTRMAHRMPPDVAQGARDQAVLRRTSAVDDIAAQVIAFCRADTVTGQTLVIDGGVVFH